jgi:hypothetical protein
MLKAINHECATDHAAKAATFNLYSNCSRRLEAWREDEAWCESEEELDHCDASRLRRLLRRKLAWYGLRAVEVGSFRSLTNDAVLVDLLEASGAVLCRVEVDRRTGIIKTSSCQTLSRLFASERRRSNVSWEAAALLVQ